MIVITIHVFTRRFETVLKLKFNFNVPIKPDWCATYCLINDAIWQRWFINVC